MYSECVVAMQNVIIHISGCMCVIRLCRFICQVCMCICRLCSCINYNAVCAKAIFIIYGCVVAYAKCIVVYVASVNISAGCEGIYRAYMPRVYMCNFRCVVVHVGIYIGCVRLCAGWVGECASCVGAHAMFLDVLPGLNVYINVSASGTNANIQRHTYRIIKFAT